ncbi:hypothetical protein [Halobacillus seohaensis]|uniref:Uncharacterized protein n=1 Tax=Halobacillus seohaensis TaxID=447421 RepID=A0ABW2EJA7_9BACI
MKSVKVILLLLIPIVVLGYSYRSKIISFLSSVPFIRKFGVRTAMRIPYVRNKFIGKLFQ